MEEEPTLENSATLVTNQRIYQTGCSFPEFKDLWGEEIEYIKITIRTTSSKMGTCEEVSKYMIMLPNKDPHGQN